MVDPRVQKEAKALIKAGHQVTIIVWDRKNEYDADIVYDGIKVIYFHNSFLMKLLLNDVFRNPIWWRKSFKKGLKLFKGGFNFDVVHCHDLDTLWAGVNLKRKTGCKLVYDAHEIFGYMIKDNVSGFFVNYAFKLEKKLIKDIDHLVTVNKPLKDYFEKITNSPITIVMNCDDIIFEKYVTSKNDVFTVLFIGNLHRSRFFPEIIDVLGNIKNIKFVIAGKKEHIELYQETEIRCGKYENVEFLGEISAREVIPKTMECDAVICVIDPKRISSRIATANKQFNAMVCGRPIICTKDTYSGDMTKSLQCGLVIDYNLDAIKDAVIKLRDDAELCRKLGENGLKAALEEYNWGIQKDKLIKVYKGLK
jgi:glycosyltransferase involved in cell wall biosynthesis